MRNILRKLLRVYFLKFLPAAIIALLIYLATHNLWLLLGSFLISAHIIFFSFSIASKDSVVNIIIYRLCGWYIGLWIWAKDDFDTNAWAVFLVFLVPILYVAGICLVFSLTITLLISPISFFVECLKK